ncbi:MAG: tetratricopeptide repeat protein [Planctomycetota bacterium]
MNAHASARDKGAGKPTTSIVLNWPLIICTVLALVAIGIGAWLWHGMRMKDLAGGAIDHGRALESNAAEVMERVTDLMTDARTLESEAADLEAAGQLEQALNRRDEAGNLYQRARELSQEAAQHRATASQYFLRYFKLRPLDPKGPIALAEVAETTGNLPAAVEWYATAIRANQRGDRDWPLEEEVRLRRAALLLEWAQAYQLEARRTDNIAFRDSAMARFRQAKQDVATVFENGVSDPRLRSKARRLHALAVFGRCELESEGATGLRVDDQQQGILEEGFEANPADGDLALALARVYHADRPADADQVMRRAVEVAERRLVDESDEEARRMAARARLARFRYRDLFDLSGAETDLRRALELDPESGTAHMRAGWQAVRRAESLATRSPGHLMERREELAKARKHFDTARDLKPGNAMAYLGLGHVQRRLGDAEEALRVYRMGLEQVDQASCELNFAFLDLGLEHGLLTAQEVEQRFESLDAGIAARRPVLSENARRLRESRRDLLQARWRFQTEEYATAIRLLERILVEGGLVGGNGDGAASRRRREFQARLLLARCREALARKSVAGAANGGDPRTEFRMAAEEYEELAVELPHVTKLRQAAGRMFLRAEEPAEAVTQLQLALDTDDTIENRMLLARAQLNQIRAAQPAERNFTNVERNLEILQQRAREERAGTPWAPRLLAAELEGLKTPQASSNVAREAEQEMYRQLEVAYPRSDELRRVLLERYRELEETNAVRRVTASRDIIRALRNQRPHDAQAALRELKEQVDEDTRLWKYYHLGCLLAQADAQPSRRSELLKEASEVDKRISARWPEWAPGRILSGALAQANDDLVSAAALLREAYELAPRDFGVLEQVLRLQLQLGGLEESKQLIQDARERFPATDDLLPLESLVLRSSGKVEAAIELARGDVARRPDDLEPRMRLGELLLEAGREAEAEEVFQEAALVAPGDPRPMIASIELYGGQGKTEEARRMLSRLAENEQWEAWRRASLLARGYQALGDAQEADKQLDKAINMCREVLDHSPSNTSLRLELVKLLLLDDAADRFDLAEEEVRGILENHPESAAAKRSLARVLWLRNQKGDRRNALEIHEQLVRDTDNSSLEDRRRLGAMYESMGEFALAETTFDSMVESALMPTDELFAHVERCLHAGKLGKAKALLARLERMAPWHSRTIRLRARFLHASGRDEAIVELLGEFEEKLSARAGNNARRRADLDRLLGDIYSGVEMHEHAERYFRRLREHSDEAIVPLATCLGAQGKVPEALQLVAEAGESIPSLTRANALARIAASPDMTEADWNRTRPALEEAMETHADRPALLLQIASAYMVRKQVAEAIKVLELVVAAEPDNIAALNNLASLLAEQPGRAAEALRYVDRAIELADRAPTLHDTKGAILLHLERPEEAVALLQRAVAGDAGHPCFRFHLAVAYHRLGQYTKANEQWRRAMEAGLEGKDVVLPPTEREWLVELKSKYAVAGQP